MNDSMHSAREKVRQLIEKYELVKKSGDINKYTEEDTKNGFIRPLFDALGWDTADRSEVTAEEHQSNGRVDFGFYVSNRLKFYLEAKPLKSDLHREEYANQAIKYSWNKGATWAVLTDFESLKVFNAQVIDSHLSDKLYFEIPYTDYLERFDQLWLLSKEAFVKNLIDKEAEKIGKKLQRVSVTSSLYKDLTLCRELLIEKLGQMNPDVDDELLDEGVQKLLDRLIFIRVAEDRGIEPPTLIPLIRDWENSKTRNEIPLYKSMIAKFRELDEIYDSNLFSEHPLEDWEDWNNTTERVFRILQGKQGYYEYDFKVIPSDVLGGVYENYLGYRLFKSKKGLTLNKDAKKRKDQGIYYTPDYVVDYIVKNTLGPVLDKCESINDLKKIKVLDPACGSGSFLIKAANFIYQKHLDFGSPMGTFTKLTILMENIYGVDLDTQAIEIARLNLLLFALDSKLKLPNLDKNIKNGNSLISGTDTELRSVYGINYREKRPFIWEEEFPEVFKQGGFDVVIGNPPWVSMSGKFRSDDFIKKEIEFLTQKYKSNTYAPNLYEMFIYKSLELLKKDGYFSFIIPDRLASNQQFVELRKHILQNFTLKHLLFNVDFPGVIADTMIFVLQKSKPGLREIIEIGDYKNQGYSKIVQKVFDQQDDKSFFYIDQKIQNLFERIFAKPSIKLLSQVAESTSGCGAKTTEIHLNKQSEKEIRIIKGENIGRYLVKGFYWFNFTDKNLTGRTRDESKLSVKNKILLRKTGSDIIATFDDSGIYPEQSLYFIYGVERDKLLLLLAILNSKLINIYYKNFAVTNRNSTPQLKNLHLDKFPIIEPSSGDSKAIMQLSEKILSLNKQLESLERNSERWNLVNSEIEKADKKIDQEVYKLYGLTPSEIEIIENGG